MVMCEELLQGLTRRAGSGTKLSRTQKARSAPFHKLRHLFHPGPSVLRGGSTLAKHQSQDDHGSPQDPEFVEHVFESITKGMLYR